MMSAKNYQVMTLNEYVVIVLCFQFFFRLHIFNVMLGINEIKRNHCLFILKF